MFDYLNARAEFKAQEIENKNKLIEFQEMNNNVRSGVLCSVVANGFSMWTKNKKVLKPKDFFKMHEEPKKEIKKQSVEEQAEQLKIFNQVIGGKTN